MFLLSALSFSSFIQPVMGFLKVLWEVLTTMIKIPIGLILIVGIWWYIDKSSSIKEAVNEAIVELVAGAELKARDAIIANKDRIIAFQRDSIKEKENLLNIANEAAEQFEQDKLEAERLAEERLDELQNRPNSGDFIDPDLYDRLHNK